MKNENLTQEKLLEKLSAQAISYQFPFRILGTAMQRDIDRYGNYSEEGLEFTKEDVQLSRLYAGLTLITKGIYDNNSNLPSDKLFMLVVNDMHSEDAKKYDSQAFPYKDPNFKFKAELKQILSIIEKYRTAKHPSLELILDHDEINHEWIVKVGKKLFHKFFGGFEDSVKAYLCNKNGVYDKLNAGGDEVQIIAGVAAFLLTKLDITDGDTSALAVLLATIVIKRGLNFYCK